MKSSPKPRVPAPRSTQEILVPVDVSPASRAVLAQAAALARTLSAQVTVLHVDEPPYPGALNEFPGSIPTNTLVEPKKLARRLQLFAAKIIPAKLAGEVLVGHGIAGQTIVAVARQRQSRLIVCGTHGYSGFKRLILGSTAEYLVRHSPCPILTMRRPSPRQPVKRLRSILAPIDLSAPSRQASTYAAGLAAKLRGPLTLLHVVPAIDDNAAGERAAARSAAKLEQLAIKLRSNGCRVNSAVAQGETTAAILAAAADTDLIVIATHGRSGLGRILLGSTAEAIIRQATCPVLVVRSPQPAKLGWFNPLFWFPVAPVMP